MTIPKAEHERLCGVEEDLADPQAGLAMQARVDSGSDEFVPETVVSRLIDGESPLRVWRDYRGTKARCVRGAASGALARWRLAALRSTAQAPGPKDSSLAQK